MTDIESTTGWWVEGDQEMEHYPHAQTADEAASDFFSGLTSERDRSEVYPAAAFRLDDHGCQYDYTDVTLVVHPDVPPCSGEHDHDWQSPHEVLGGIKENPGVWGKGGGVVCREVCSYCGRYRITDTWADDGQGGVMSEPCITYEDANDESQAWAERQHLPVYTRRGEWVDDPDGFRVSFAVTTQDRIVLQRDDHLDGSVVYTALEVESEDYLPEHGEPDEYTTIGECAVTNI